MHEVLTSVTVHICYYQVKNLVTMSLVVDELTELWRKLQEKVRLVAIKVTKEEELGSWELHFE